MNSTLATVAVVVILAFLVLATAATQPTAMRQHSPPQSDCTSTQQLAKKLDDIAAKVDLLEEAMRRGNP